MRVKGVDTGCITLVAAAGCNLSCEYCNICGTQNQYSGELLKDIIQSIENGSYIENIYTVLNRVDQSPSRIEYLTIWGQEPTIMMPHLTAHIQEWLEAFPNVKDIFFSTNGVNSPDIVFNFIKAVDTYAKHEIKIGIQWSYDGNYGTANVRGANAPLVVQHIIEFNQLLNNYNLKQVKVEGTLHGVLSYPLMKEVNTMEKMHQFLQNLDDFCEDVHNSWNNKNVTWVPSVTTQYVNGTYSTTEDGLLFASFCQLFRRAIKQKPYNQYKYIDNDMIFEILGSMPGEIINELNKFNMKSVDDYIEYIFKNKDESARYSETPYCGAYLSDLKIMYDGSVTTCQNYIYDLYMDKENLPQTVSAQSRKNYVEKHTHLLNFITATDEEIQQFINHHNSLIFQGTWKTMMHSVANMIYLMAQCGEVDPNYLKDMKKLRRHAFYVSILCTCLYNIMYITGSTIVRSTGDIRQMCNGVLDLFDEQLNYVIEGRK